MNTYTGHFQKLIDVCESFGPSYNPVPEALQITSLRSQLENVQSAINVVDSELTKFITAESARSDQFALLPPLATRVQAIAITLNLPGAILLHIKEVVRKIRGQRTKPVKPDPNDEKKHISVSQVSFNEQIEHTNQLVWLAASQPAYTPTEADLTAAALNNFLAALRSTNDAAMDRAAILDKARQERDKLLYAPKTGMIDTALTVKEYVKAVFGAKSPQYKEVQHIAFRNK
jgi:hypothetical protein